jgi:hypothetical protein
MNALFPRPRADTLVVERLIATDIKCQSHPQARVETYPVLRANGWKRISRCPECLAVLRESEPPTPLGFSYVPPSIELSR